MLLLGCHIPKSYIFFTVLITAVIAYPYPEDEKTFNLKIGFDLTHGENGAPSLRVRDFEDSKEFSPRAADNDDKKHDDENNDNSEVVKKGGHSKKGKDLRAQSVSSESSDEKDDSPKVKGKKSSSESKEAAKSNKKSGSEDDDGDSGDSDVDFKHSTRGLNPGEYEPEEKNLGIHDRDPGEVFLDRRRSKRAAKNFLKYYNESIMKRKHKKANHVKSRARMTSYKPY